MSKLKLILIFSSILTAYALGFFTYKWKKGSEKVVEVVKIETKYVDRIKEVKVKGDTIVQKIPVYIESDVMLPAGFRVLHDSAATGNDPTGIADATSISVADASLVIFDNYTGCRKNYEQVLALQEFIKKGGD